MRAHAHDLRIFVKKITCDSVLSMNPVRLRLCGSASGLVRCRAFAPPRFTLRSVSRSPVPVAVSHAAQRHTEERNSSKITTSGNWNKHQPQEKLEMNQQLDLIQQKGELGLEMQDQVKRHEIGRGRPVPYGRGPAVQVVCFSVFRRRTQDFPGLCWYYKIYPL